MPKKELHPFHVQAPQRFRKRRRRKLFMRLGRNTKVTAEEVRGVAAGSGEDLDSPIVSSVVKRPWHRGLKRWSLLWLSVFSMVGTTVIAGVLLLTKLPPPVHCQSISALASDSDRLYCAQVAAQSGKVEQLEAAIKLVQNWSSDHPLYSEAQRLLKQWSQALLQLAEQNAKQGHQQEAAKIASKIPASSLLYAEAQARIADWQQDLQQAQRLVRQFNEALLQQNWQQASQLIAKSSQLNQEYWSVSRTQALSKQLETEKQAWQQLQEARDLAKSNQLAQLQAALALAGKVNPNSFVKAQALLEQSRWSRTLLAIAESFFNNHDFASVINTAQAIPTTISQYTEAKDWVRLAYAAKSAKKDNILALVDALAIVQQIEPKSPLHRLAIAKADLWQQQLSDLVQLQAAGVLASFEQRSGLEKAIQVATQVPPGHSMRIRAQTLIAEWRKQMQHIEDRKLQAQAEQLASRGTLAQLKSAVAVASQIKLGQPLRIQAQTAIAQWNRRIETIEDQPILDLAQTLAQRQDLIAAISTAKQIRPDRALYAQAQQAIADWQAQVQTAQDRPILDAATALAAQGRFDAAIATAAQITPGRALYEQAQALISDWASQQAAIRESQLAPMPPLDQNNQTASPDQN